MSCAIAGVMKWPVSATRMVESTVEGELAAITRPRSNAIR